MWKTFFFLFIFGVIIRQFRRYKARFLFANFVWNAWKRSVSLSGGREAACIKLLLHPGLALAAPLSRAVPVQVGLYCSQGFARSFVTMLTVTLMNPCERTLVTVDRSTKQRSFFRHRDTYPILFYFQQCFWLERFRDR